MAPSVVSGGQIVPTLCVGMLPWTLCVQSDAERHGIHSHAERGNERQLLVAVASAHMRMLNLRRHNTATYLQPLQNPALIRLRPLATALAQVEQLRLQGQ